MVPVVTGWSSEDDTEANAVLVALNRTTERGGWNEPNLLHILKELSVTDSLDLAGYGAADLAILEKITEADSVFDLDMDSIVDEFIDEQGLDNERIQLKYSSVLRVYFQTEESRKQFFDAIEYDDKNTKTIRYPKTFQREKAPIWEG